MADDLENTENTMTDDDQISEDDWAAAMAEQAPSDAGSSAMSGVAAQPADIFPSFGGGGQQPGILNELDMILDIPVQITVELGRTKITIKNLLQLAHGSVVELDATTERVIGEAAAILQKCPGSPVVIEGHANRDGERRGFDNMDLSLRRALRVRDELVRRGIEPGHLAVKGYSSARPLVPHEAPEARAMNRRVQFTVAK